MVHWPFSLFLFLSFCLSFLLIFHLFQSSCVVVLSVAWKCSLVLLQGETVWCSCTERLSHIVDDRAPNARSLVPPAWKCTNLLHWMPSFGRLVTCFHLHVILDIWYPSVTVEKNHYCTLFFLSFFFFTAHSFYLLICPCLIFLQLHPSCFK